MQEASQDGVTGDYSDMDEFSALQASLLISSVRARSAIAEGWDY